MNAPVAIGNVIAERYRVDRMLGEGGMGVVVAATHLVLHQPVAIKFLRRERMIDADAVGRFVREARAAAMVRSEHVVRVHDVAQLDDGTPFLVMEYLEGINLGHMLQQRGPLVVSEAVRYVLQICEALAETHASGIVHGDLKPENVYIAGFSDESLGRVKLLDFGISRITSDRTASDMGTPAYMAPEQFESGVIDVRTDLWALGAVFHEMLTGRPPFAALTSQEIAHRVVAGLPDPIDRTDVPLRLRNIILKLLDKDPHERFTDVVELAAALEEFKPSETTLERLRPAASRLQRDRSQRHAPTVVLPDRKRRRAMWLGIVGALLMVLVGSLVVVFGRRNANAQAVEAARSASAPGNAIVTVNAVTPAPSAVVTAAPVEDTTFEVAAPVQKTEPPAPAPPAPVAVHPAVAAAPVPNPPKARPVARAPAASATPAAPKPAALPAPTKAESEDDRFGTRK